MSIKFFSSVNECDGPAFSLHRYFRNLGLTLLFMKKSIPILLRSMKISYKNYRVDHCETHLKSKLELAMANAIRGDNGNMTSKLKTSSPDLAKSIAYFL